MLIVIEAIPFKTFREKINIVKRYIGKARIEICKGFVIIEQIEREGGLK